MDLQKIKVVAMDLDGTLTQHRQHPEKYRNLQVRVCGWNIPDKNVTGLLQSNGPVIDV